MLHVQFVFLLIRSISLEAIFIVVPRLHDLFFFCLHVLLARASLLALAKSIYYRGTSPYGLPGNTVTPFLSAGQNGHTFSCQKTPSTVLQFVVLKNAVGTFIK